MDGTGFGRLGAWEEALPEHFGAGRRGELARFLVDVHEDDTLGRLEGLARVACESARHEGGPDWQRGLRAAEADGLVVVEANPDHCEEFRREAHEPGVAEVVRG